MEKAKQRHVALILAGGVGSRVGAECPKQFIQVLGKPVLYYTIQAYQGHDEIDAIEVVCIASYLERLRTFVQAEGLTKVRWIVPGGEDFQHSVMCGLAELKKHLHAEDLVLIHYGASPCVSADIISDAIRVAEEKGNGVSVTPCYQLYGSNDGDHSDHWIDRDTIIQIAAPQCFTLGLLQDAYRKGEELGLLDEVEPHTTSLMYKLGIPLYFSKGNQQNIKITEASDLLMVEGYLLVKQRVKNISV